MPPQKYIFFAWAPYTEHERDLVQPDFSATYDLTSDIPATLGLWGTGTWPKEPATVDVWLGIVSNATTADSKKHGKKKVTVSFFEDDCDAALRAYVQQLMQVVQVASYGSCLRNADHPAVKKDAEARRLHSRADPEHKLQEARLQAARGSMFCLVVDRMDAVNFLSQSLSMAFAAGCVPVYYGTGQANMMAPHHSFVNAHALQSARRQALLCGALQRTVQHTQSSMNGDNMWASP
eukprot:CAMPEP_0114273500 /NCGR_PEP_ID=MMETSP0058-20121206/29151_1 /TAXON_ID=36894 /ORGANISM="Pyramimonas parkeae, CCMP726" /LENGTH=234 /DNA_ID=CAMNT_0001393001 /DNA_START=80 /DNA_END=785 /DNA_ORIENTATION=+